MKRFITILILLAFKISLGVETKVILLSGGTDEYRTKVEKVLTTVLNKLNKAYETHGTLDGIEQHFKPAALKQFVEIVRRTNPHAIQREYRTYLLTTTDGYYEVRNLKIHVFMGTTEGVPFQNFVFVLNNEAVIEHVHFSIEEHIYQDIIEEGKRLEDLAYREKILHSGLDAGS